MRGFHSAFYSRNCHNLLAWKELLDFEGRSDRLGGMSCLQNGLGYPHLGVCTRRHDTSFKANALFNFFYVRSATLLCMQAFLLDLFLMSCICCDKVENGVGHGFQCSTCCILLSTSPDFS